MGRPLQFYCPLVATAWLFVTGVSAWGAAPLGTVWTYQGQLERDGSRVNDTCDCQFSLWDDPVAGAQVGPTLTFNGQGGNPPPIAVAGGLLTAPLDFGAGAFGNAARWLEIEVACPSGGALQALSPRQPVTATPTAQFALQSSQWRSIGNTITNANTGFVGINRDYTVGLEWFGVHAPVSSGYGGMYVTTDGANAWPFYGYRSGNGQAAWTYLNGATGDWHVSVDGTRLTVTDEGNVGIGTTSPAYPLQVTSLAGSDRTIFAENSASTGAALRGHATSATGINFGVWGESLSSSGAGVTGYAASTTGANAGGRFSTESASGTGVHAVGGLYGVSASAFPTSGETWAGFFQHYAPSGAGVFGIANHPTGTASGVRGQTASPGGVGVNGINTASSGTTYAVRGLVNSAAGYAGYFEGGRNYFQGNVGIGTLTPANPLSVTGGADIIGPVSIGITGADARLLVRGTTGEDAFRVRVEGGTKLLVKDNGGVGIGSNFGSLPANGLRTVGSVGIGADPGAFMLVSNGDAAKPGGGSWSVFSDARLKRGISDPAPGMLDRVLLLRGRTFEYISEAIEHRLGRPGRQIGLVAQEVEKVFPEWVDKDDEGYRYVTERGQTAILVEALRELRAEKDAKIAELEERLARLEALLQAERK